MGPIPHAFFNNADDMQVSRMMHILGLLLCSIIQGGLGGLWSNSNCPRGKETIVHLFEWKWTDVATECEQTLGPAGYCGVQISPPHENRVISLPNRPWFERYQPVSYKLVTRSGNEREFRDMVERCNKAGIRIYADVTLNHMAEVGTSGLGTGGSYYTDPLYPMVQFSDSDFNSARNCSTKDLNVHNYTNQVEVRNCRLAALNDLKIFSSHVEKVQLEFLNKLIDIGVAGFRIDAAKHMWPSELERLYLQLHHLNTRYFPFDTRPLILHEDLVIDTVGLSSGVQEYSKTAKVTNYEYGYLLAKTFLGDTANLKILNGLEKNKHWPASSDVVVFIDDSASQRGYGPVKVLSNFEDPRSYKMANVFMLAYPYGLTRVMSSYYWPRKVVNGSDVNSWMGPPSAPDMSTLGVFEGNDTSCQNGWICEHRWRATRNMVAFRNAAEQATLSNWWSNEKRQFAFARQGKGFLVMNAGNSPLSMVLLTTLPKGTYCDVISGDFLNGVCTGKTVHVNELGQADFTINSRQQEPMIAIHIGAVLQRSPDQNSIPFIPGLFGRKRN